MNYQQQEAHKLRGAWEAEDYAKEAKRYAIASQQFHQLVAERSVAMQAERDRTSYEIASLKREVSRLESNQNGMTRRAILYGGMSGIVCAIAVSLILAPQPQQRPLPKAYYPPMERGQ